MSYCSVLLNESILRTMSCTCPEIRLVLLVNWHTLNHPLVSTPVLTIVSIRRHLVVSEWGERLYLNWLTGFKKLQHLEISFGRVVCSEELCSLVYHVATLYDRWSFRVMSGQTPYFPSSQIWRYWMPEAPWVCSTSITVSRYVC